MALPRCTCSLRRLFEVAPQPLAAAALFAAQMRGTPPFPGSHRYHTLPLFRILFTTADPSPLPHHACLICPSLFSPTFHRLKLSLKPTSALSVTVDVPHRRHRTEHRYLSLTTPLFPIPFPLFLSRSAYLFVAYITVACSMRPDPTLLSQALLPDLCSPVTEQKLECVHITSISPHYPPPPPNVHIIMFTTVHPQVLACSPPLVNDTNHLSAV